MNMGKEIRIRKLMNEKTGKVLIVALDHSPLMGPVVGKPREIVNEIIEGGCDALLIHEGFAKDTYDIFPKHVNFILKLTTATKYSADNTHRVLVSSVRKAVYLGAIGVAINVFVGSEYELEMLELMGRISDQCEEYGMPLLPIMYTTGTERFGVEKVKVAATIGAELGGDIIKTHYTGDKNSFESVINSCTVPIIMSGGPKTDTTEEFLKMVKGAIDAGAKGVAIGRNIWQRKDPCNMVRAIRAIIHENVDVSSAMNEFSLA